MAQGRRDELMVDGVLIEALAEVAKNAALLQGVLMRLQESPNASEVGRLR